MLRLDFTGREQARPIFPRLPPSPEASSLRRRSRFSPSSTFRSTAPSSSMESAASARRSTFEALVPASLRHSDEEKAEPTFMHLILMTMLYGMTTYVSREWRETLHTLARPPVSVSAASGPLEICRNAFRPRRSSGVSQICMICLRYCSVG